MPAGELEVLLRRNLGIAERIAGEGIVLLKNHNNLPLSPEVPLAVFGRGQIDTKISGSGSGASESKNSVNIISALKEIGFNLEKELLDFYETKLSLENEDSFQDFLREKQENCSDSELPWWYEFWGKYKPSAPEIILDDQIVKKASESTDTALFIISRHSGGEEYDRHLKDDYYLSDEEKRLLKQVCSNFDHVIVVLNIAGVIDLSCLNDFPVIEGLLNISLPGEIAGKAVAEVLTGKITPSGKLVDTYALSYQDYPSSEHFSFNKDKPDSIKSYQDYGLDAEKNGSKGFNISPVTVYQEGIYTGYRYFDTFGVDVLYPFAYGLSYTEFSIDYLGSSFNIEKQIISLNLKLRNIGSKYSGKEVIQVYLSKPDGILEKPYQELVAYQKSRNLGICESQKIDITFSLDELSSYDQNTASYIIEKGYYYIRIGNSSRNTTIRAKIYVPEMIVVEKLSNQLGLNRDNEGKIDFLSKKKARSITYLEEQQEMESAEITTTITPEMIKKKEKVNKNTRISSDKLTTGSIHKNKDMYYKLEDVYTKKISIEKFVSQLSVEELAVLCNGYSTGQAFGGDSEAAKTIADDSGINIGSNSSNFIHNDFVSLSPAIKRFDIPFLAYQDGPAGIGYTSWPVETMMASSWNDELLYAFGDAIGQACEFKGINVWLGPAINLHRNPIAGRNFEYYSEDPLLSGRCAVAVTKGVMDNHNVSVSAKHFVLNEQETYRRGHSIDNIDAVDSIAEERTIREIYLKPFEILVKNTDILNIMTSFNKINGTFAASNKELNINILRQEWGYRGYLVTDWGDMDIVVDGADAVAAGNDVIMPGGPPAIAEVLRGHEEGRVTLEELRRSAVNFLSAILKLKPIEE